MCAIEKCLFFKIIFIMYVGLILPLLLRGLGICWRVIFLLLGNSIFSHSSSLDLFLGNGLSKLKLLLWLFFEKIFLDLLVTWMHMSEKINEFLERVFFPVWKLIYYYVSKTNLYHFKSFDCWFFILILIKYLFY